jgi:hypothetical protein
MPRPVKNTLTRVSFFSGWTVVMALSLLSVIGLLVWWQRLLSHISKCNMAIFSHS